MTAGYHTIKHKNIPYKFGLFMLHSIVQTLDLYNQ